MSKFSKNFTFAATIAVLAAFAVIISVGSAEAKVSKNLKYGMRNDSEVKNLQQFLNTSGYLKVAPTGNFLDSTLSAVKSFQTANNIPATGFVGPMTLSAINGKSVNGEASLSVNTPVSGKIEVGDTQKVTWTSNNYSAPTVSVKLIRKVKSNPDRYEVVRVISDSTANDGVATWVPAQKDINKNLSIEVGCTLTSSACRGGNITGDTLAVIKSNRFQNTASAYQAIEQLNNK